MTRLFTTLRLLILEFLPGIVTINCMSIYITLYIYIYSATKLSSSPEEFGIRQQVGLYL